MSLRRILLISLFLAGGHSSFALAETETSNLLDGAVWETSTQTTLDHDALARLLDNDPSTIVRLPVIDDQPIDLVFRLPGSMAAPEAFSLTLSAEGPAPVNLDLLVSSISDTVGFSSVRRERIDSLNAGVSFSFAPMAARWAMIRLTPPLDADQIVIGDLILTGRVGLPESFYAFDQSPAEALELIQSLKALGTEGLALTDAELDLFGPTNAAELTAAQFEQIALHASGVMSETDRTTFQDQITALENQARQEIDLSGDASTTGAALLDWLHTDVLTGGYAEGQTNLSDLLSTRVYNCVSSAAIYASLGQRLGLDVRAIEVPDHAFAILYDGADHSDVETTTSLGFDPSRERLAEFEQLTGYTYIPQTNKAKRREIGLAGLAALIYYNHGVFALREDRYADALVANFRALSLDPEFDSAVKNALAALGRWSFALADEGEWEAAIEIARIGVSLVPDDTGLAARQTAVWRRWATTLSDKGDRAEAVAVLVRASAAIPGAVDDFADAQAYLFIKSGEALIDASDWPGALLAADTSGYVLHDAALQTLGDWQRNVYLRWAKTEMDAGHFGKAREILGAGLKSWPDDRRIVGNLRYVAQEGAQAAVSYGDGLGFLADTIAMYPNVRGLQDSAENYVDRSLSDPAKASDIATGLAMVAQAVALFDDPGVPQELGALVYERHGHPLIDARDWAAAAEVYSAGRIAYPGAGILTTNARYIAQNWQREALETGGPQALTEVNASLRLFFPDFAGSGDFAEAEVRRQIARFADDGQFDAAQKALDAAQLLLSTDSFQEMSVYIIDRRARGPMAAKDWAKAAEVYATGLQNFPGDSHLSRNATYVAQEWTRSSQANGGADALSVSMRRLEVLFPGNDDIAEMGLTTLRRALRGAIDAGRNDEARQLVADVKPILTPDGARALAITFFDTLAQSHMKTGDWPAALEAYAQGRALYPDARDLNRNLRYIAQEWIKDSYAADGTDGVLAVFPVLQVKTGDADGLDRALESHFGREASAIFAAGDPEAALLLIDTASPALRPDTVGDLKAIIYDKWARQTGEGGDWPSAVALYDRGIAELGDIYPLSNNRRWAASQ